MFLAHSIRLRDPWQCAATAAGGVRWSRRFHRPTGLEPDDQLLLVLSGLPAAAVVAVNGHDFNGSKGQGVATEECGDSVNSSGPIASQPLSAPIAQQYDLTPILADANEIEIVVPPDPLRRHVEPQLGDSFPCDFPYDARLAIIGHS